MISVEQSSESSSIHAAAWQHKSTWNQNGIKKGTNIAFFYHGEYIFYFKIKQILSMELHVILLILVTTS